MDNLYYVNENVDYGEYCYVIKAKTINHALAYYMNCKRDDGATDYILETDDENIKRGKMLDEDGYEDKTFTIQKLEFNSTNVAFIGGYEE